MRVACLEVASIIEDWRSQAVGGIEAAFVLWEACCIPTLINGSGNWLNMTSAAEQKLEAIQNWFVRLILRVAPGCPAPSLRWDTGLLSMVLRVWVEKIMLVRHVRGLGANTLAHQVYQEQRSHSWPGLAKEATRICERLGIEDCNSADMGKWTNKQYRKMVTESCRHLDKQNLLEAARGLSKCKRMLSESYGRKDYMTSKTIIEVRKQFCSRFGMQPFAGNFKNSLRFQGTEWKCRCGLYLEEESHLIGGDCPVYGDLRESYPDLDEDDDQLLRFFAAVLERRARLEEEEAMEVGGTSDIASPTGRASV